MTYYDCITNSSLKESGYLEDYVNSSQFSKPQPPVHRQAVPSEASSTGRWTLTSRHPQSPMNRNMCSHKPALALQGNSTVSLTYYFKGKTGIF